MCTVHSSHTKFTIVLFTVGLFWMSRVFLDLLDVGFLGMMQNVFDTAVAHLENLADCMLFVLYSLVPCY